MAEIGNGYGSECHLLRYMGRHRKNLDQAVIASIGLGKTIEWLDFPFDPKKPWKDSEWKGLDFLADRRLIQEAWKNFWPQGAGIQNWDAVGWLESPGNRELLLVEAKANLEEIRSDCGGKEKGGLPRIRESISITKQSLEVSPDRDWLCGYYQFANRLAVLHFLGTQRLSARLVMIYFTGDAVPGRTCPASAKEWSPALQAQSNHLGLPSAHALLERVHKVFLPICPQ